MKLAFCVFKYFPFGGLERNLLRMAEACRVRGHEVHVFTMQWQGKQPEGLKVVLVPYRGVTNHSRCLSYVAALKRMLEGEKYDLVVGFNRMPGLDLYYAADVCYLLDMERRRTVLSRLTPRYRVYADLERQVFSPDSDTEIMYLSEAEKKNYISVYHTQAERFHYLPPGIDKERIRSSLGPTARHEIRSEFGLRDDEELLLMVGSGKFQRKGVDRAIRALGALPPNVRKKSHLLVIGKGKPRPMQKLAVRLGIADQVRFLGTRHDVPRFLAAADLFLLPAVSENTGNVIVEAMVAGVPVLATEACGYAFHVTRAAAGDVIPSWPFRQEAMNDMLAAALTSPMRDQWRDNALRYTDETDLYSRPQVAADIIEELAHRKAGKHGKT